MRTSAVVLAVVLSTITFTGCSSTSGAEEGPVTLDYWAWAPGSQAAVDAFNNAHPDIQVKYTDAGGGETSSAKLFTALRAGSAPDLALVENTSLPRMIVAGVPLDITDRSPSD